LRAPGFQRHDVRQFAVIVGPAVDDPLLAALALALVQACVERGDARKLDAVRIALRRADLAAASK
jgi:hypothetical protein